MLRTTSSILIRHYARGQRSPDSAIVCVGRNPIDTISPEMGLKERAACALHTRIPRNVAWGCLSIIGLGTRSVQRGRRDGCFLCCGKHHRVEITTVSVFGRLCFVRRVVGVVPAWPLLRTHLTAQGARGSALPQE